MKTLQDIRPQKKRVLVRSSLNVPMEYGHIQDDFRLQESVSTIRHLLEQEAVCIVMSHLGRPAPIFQIGKSQIPNPKSQKEFTLKPIAKRLGELLGKEVPFFGNPIGEELQSQIAQMKPGAVAVLENLRFYKGEKENDPAFSRKLASLGDIYVNDSFDACHRAHASIVGVPALLPHAAGLLVEKEVEVLEKIRERPERPMIVVVGGAKAETKAAFLKAMSRNADAILLGNLISKEAKEQRMETAGSAELVYAQDGVAGDFDLGPKTIERFAEKIKGAKTIFWAGPLGKIEEKRYEKGSLEIAQTILASGAYAVAGGGDLAAFLGKHHLREKFDHVSTGGGAMLAFLAGEELPGLKALESGE